MKLTTITARNFKGQTFTEDVATAMIFVGANFAGKTARTDAIRLLLLGYLPELGKTARATFDLASGTDMEVSGVFDNGQTIRRRFYLKGDTVKVDEEIPADIADCGQLAVMLNAEAYFALSDRARVEYVFANCAIDGDAFTPPNIASRVDAAVGTKMKWPISIVESDPQKFIDDSLTQFAVDGKSAKDHATRMGQTIVGLTDLRAQDEQATPATVLEDARARITREMTTITENRGRLLGSYTAIRAARTRRAEIERELRFADKDAQLLVDARAKLKMVQDELALPSTVLDAAVVQSALDVANANLTGAKIRLSEVQTAKHKAERDMANIDHQQTCPYCGASGDGWKNIKLGELAQQVDAQSLQLVSIGTARAEAENEVARLRAQLAEIADARGRRQSLVNTERELLNNIASMEPRAARVTALREEQAKLVADDPLLEQQVEALQGDHNIKANELRQVENQLREGAGRKHELKRLADAEAARDKAVLEQDVAKVAEKELRVIQAEMVEQAFAPLLATANRFFAQVMRSPLAYNKGEIGTWRDGIWVSHFTMSGTEKALVFAAIQTALAIKSPCRVMILDELGRLDNTNVVKVMASVLDAVTDGRLDNFVGIDAGRAPFYHQLAANCVTALTVREIGA